MQAATKMEGVPSREHAMIVDEFGILDAEHRLNKHKDERRESLRKEIDGWYANQDATQSYIAMGKRFAVTVSPRAIERTIHIPRLFKIIGKAVFLTIAKVTLKDAAAATTEDAAKYITSDQTGARTIKAVPLP